MQGQAEGGRACLRLQAPTLPSPPLHPLQPAVVNGVTVRTEKRRPDWAQVSGQVFKNKYLRSCGRVHPMPTKPEEKKTTLSVKLVPQDLKYAT